MAFPGSWKNWAPEVGKREIWGCGRDNEPQLISELLIAPEGYQLGCCVRGAACSGIRGTAANLAVHISAGARPQLGPGLPTL